MTVSHWLGCCWDRRKAFFSPAGLGKQHPSIKSVSYWVCSCSGSVWKPPCRPPNSFFFFLMFIYFERERQSEKERACLKVCGRARAHVCTRARTHTHTQRRDRERERESQAGSLLSDSGLELMIREIMTWAKIRSQMLKSLSHPGTQFLSKQDFLSLVCTFPSHDQDLSLKVSLIKSQFLHI